MNVLDYPARISSLYSTQNVDDKISIYAGPMTVVFGADSYSGSGRVDFVWSPSAGVCWEMADVDAAFHSFSLEKVRLRIPGYENEILARVTSISASSHDPSKISGFIENGEGRQTSSDLGYVLFVLPNFIPFMGSVVRDVKGNSASASRAELRGGGWKITLDSIWGGRSGKSDVDEHFILSHVGRLEREDGQSFSPSDAKSILDNLYWFLSFCRGRPTPAILPVGFNSDGKETWSEWGAWNVTRFKHGRNWYNDFSAEGLEKVFPEFLNRITSGLWKQATQLSIYWYLEAEDAGSDSSIILAQAAFELLSWAYFVEAEKQYSADEFELISPREKLLLLLKKIGLSTEIPNSLEQLSVAASNQHWESGPSAISGIQNALLHPTAKNLSSYEVLTARSLFEASQLTLWYLEMILLWLFDYRAKYSNRLILSGWKGEEVQVVPWASTPVA